MVVCFICKSEFSNNKGGQLTNHLKNDHNITLLEYVILTEYDNIPPKCKCGLCDEIPHLYRGKFLQYAKGHDSFKRREEMKNWKTTVSGVVVAAGTGMVQASDPTVQMIGQIVSVIGAILLGIFAKDSNVTGS